MSIFFFYRYWTLFVSRPKAEGLVRGLKHPVYCKRFNKQIAIHIYTDAYEENRLQRLLE